MKHKNYIVGKIIFVIIGILCSILLVGVVKALWFDVDNVNYGNYMMLIPGVESLLGLGLVITVFSLNRWSRLFGK